MEEVAASRAYLIEHIYDLETFFSDLTSINSSMPMIFTTASTPYNPHVKWKLHRAMKGCETGILAQCRGKNNSNI